MKFIKKAAALFFCAALALSVMAISALADDEAVLLVSETGGVKTVKNSDYKVKLSRTPTDAAADPFNENIYDRDNVTGVEINATDDVTFDITLFYTGSEDSPVIDAFEFDYDADDNDSAVIATEVINESETNEATLPLAFVIYSDNQNAAPVRMTTYDNGGNCITYAYSSEGSEDADIAPPDDEDDENGRVIGRITVSFDGATENKAIYPKIKNLRITLRNDDETMQQPVAWTSEHAGTSAPSDDADDGNGVVIDTINTDSVYTNASSPTATETGCIIVATEPVYVNPVYKVALKTFAEDSETGIIAVQDEDNDVTLFYNFSNGSFVTPKHASKSDVTKYTHTDADDTTGATILTNPSFPGYTFQGWMVTSLDFEHTQDDVQHYNQITWAAYDGSWDKVTSYPATTDNNDDKFMDDADVWGDDDWYNTGATNEDPDDRVDPDEELLVNFIPAGADLTSSSATYTKFPPGMVGDITLTPVFTRNVYTATFYAGDNKATFGTDYVAEDDADSTQADSWSMHYTIEDLYSAEAAAAAAEGEEVEEYPGYEDFLLLNDTNNDAIADAAKGPQGLARKAYKFVGWTVSESQTDDVGLAEGEQAPQVVSGYEWTQGGHNAVTGEELLVEASAKHYGNVTFTAQWEADIYFAKIAYQYAGDGNALILVGVPADSTNTRDNYESAYTYKCGGVAMFKVPALLDTDWKETDENDNNATECAQRSAYVQAALSAENPEEWDYEKACVTTFDGNIFGEDCEYVIFAYIRAIRGEDDETASDTDVTDITIEETEDSDNRALAYNGDVDNSGRVNVGDFGNVDTLLNDTETSSVFAITGNDGRWGVRARLQADVTTAIDTTEQSQESALHFGSIKDIKGIYEKLGNIAS